MMRRLFWFLSGAAAGASIVVWVKRTITSVSEKMTPANIADLISSAVRRMVMGISDAASLLIDRYRNRNSLDTSGMSAESPDEAPQPVRRHNPPRQRTSHR